eukprot:g68766.t1
MSGFALKTGLLCRSVLASGTLSPPVVRAMSVVSLRDECGMVKCGNHDNDGIPFFTSSLGPSGRQGLKVHSGADSGVYTSLASGPFKAQKLYHNDTVILLLPLQCHLPLQTPSLSESERCGDQCCPVERVSLKLDVPPARTVTSEAVLLSKLDGKRSSQTLSRRSCFCSSVIEYDRCSCGIPVGMKLIREAKDIRAEVR